MWRVEPQPPQRRSQAARAGAAAPPDMALRRLQRAVGNRGLARLLARVQVTGAATGSAQQHHPNYSFTFPGDTEAKTFDLDKWITDKIESPAVSYAATRPAVAVAVNGALDAWDGSSSIIGALVDRLIAATQVTDWASADVRQDVLDAAEGRALVSLLLSLKANIRLREDDIATNVPSEFTVMSTPKVVPAKTSMPPEKLTVQWSTSLARARLALRDKLRAVAPEFAPADKNDVRLVDAVILAKPDPALTRLVEVGALAPNNKGQARFKSDTFTGAGAKKVNHVTTFKPPNPDKPDEADFNFGLNHLRFILFLEWKLLSQLLKPAPKQ